MCIRDRLRAGADVNARNEDGQTALSVAANMREHTELMVRLLVSRGATTGDAALYLPMLRKLEAGEPLTLLALGSSVVGAHAGCTAAWPALKPSAIAPFVAASAALSSSRTCSISVTISCARLPPR